MDNGVAFIYIQNIQYDLSMLIFPLLYLFLFYRFKYEVEIYFSTNQVYISTIHNKKKNFSLYISIENKSNCFVKQMVLKVVIFYS